jgi:hypothetical protein
VASLGVARAAAWAVAGRSAWGAHDHALAVVGQHQQIPGHAQMPGSLGVELVEVDRSTLGELFDLPVAQPLSADPGDRLGGLGKGAPSAVAGGEQPQSVRVLLGSKVQDAVSEVQAGVPGLAVGGALHGDRPEHRAQRAATAGLGVSAADSVGPHHLLQPGLALRTQVQMVLGQLPQQLPTLGLQPRLQLPMGQLLRLLTIQPGHHRLEPLTRLAERSTRDLQRVCSHLGLLLLFWSDTLERRQKEPTLLAVTFCQPPVTNNFNLPSEALHPIVFDVLGDVFRDSGRPRARISLRVADFGGWGRGDWLSGGLWPSAKRARTSGEQLVAGCQAQGELPGVVIRRAGMRIRR